jgi:hypothetical protein
MTSWDTAGHSSSSGSSHTNGGGAHHTEVEVTIVGDHDSPAGKEAMTSQLGGRARGERWYGLDWIRFICIFYVVFGHTYKVLLSHDPCTPFVSRRVVSCRAARTHARC